VLREEDVMRRAWLVVLALAMAGFFYGCGEGGGGAEPGGFSDMTPGKFQSISEGMMFDEVGKTASGGQVALDAEGNGTLTYRTEEGNLYIVHFEDYKVVRKETTSDELMRETERKLEDSELTE
jgi:hypothetical protein